ncbi:MAG: DUF4434 domain-containing protein [Christensenellales bacterium]|jgi:hypothetical protein
MKTFNRIIAVILLIVSCFTLSGCKGKDIAYAKGTFIQSWMLNGFSDEDYIEEFDNMAAMKIEYLVYMDAAFIDSGGDYSEVTYPSHDESRTGDGFNTGILDKVLYYCNEYSIKCYIGLINDGRWWLNTDLTDESNKSLYLNSCAEMAEVLEEIYTLYYDKYPAAFYGVYFPTELYNHFAYSVDAKRNAYSYACAEGLNTVISKINELNPSLPLMLSPFINPLSGVFCNAENNGEFYLELINKTNFREYDLLCPQDSIGARDFPVQDVYQWYDSYVYALDNANKKITFGINVECFSTEGDIDYLYPANIARFVLQLEAANKYTDNIYSFALPHYYNGRITEEGFSKSYGYYLENGVAEKTPPEKVNNFKGVINDNKVTLSWDESTDEYGISGYNIYKCNAEGEDKILLRRGVFDNREIQPSLELSYSNGCYFAIEAVDCTGNVSKKSYCLKD